MVVEPQHATAVIYKFCFKILRRPLGHLKKNIAGNRLPQSLHVQWRCYAAMPVFWSYSLRNSAESKRVSTVNQQISDFINTYMRTMVLEYIYIPTWLPLSKITQFCRFLYTSTILFAYGLYLIFNDKIMGFSHDFRCISWDFPWDFLDIFDWVPAPLRASRKVTLRLASSKKLRSESKVNTLHIIYKIYRRACIYYIIIILYYIILYYIILWYYIMILYYYIIL